MKCGFQVDANCCKSPFDAEEDPTECSLDADKGYRCVGTGDEEIDGGVVKLLEYAFDGGDADGMVERGDAVHQNKRDTEYQCPGNVYAAAALSGKQCQDTHCRHAEQ